MAEAGGSIGLQFSLPPLPELHETSAGAGFQLMLNASQESLQKQAPQLSDPGAAPQGAQPEAPLPPGMAPPVQGAGPGDALPTLPGRAPNSDAPGLSPLEIALAQPPTGTLPSFPTHPPVAGPQPQAFVPAQDAAPRPIIPVMMAPPAPTGSITAHPSTSPPTPVATAPVMPQAQPASVAKTANPIGARAPAPLQAAAVPAPPAAAPQAASPATPAAQLAGTPAPTTAAPPAAAPKALAASPPPPQAFVPPPPSVPHAPAGLVSTPTAPPLPQQAQSPAPTLLQPAAPASEGARQSTPGPAAAPNALPHAATISGLTQPATLLAADPLQAAAQANAHPPSQNSSGLLAVPPYAFALPTVPTIQAARPRQFQHLRAYRQPPNPELYWAQSPSTPSARLIAFTDRRPVPLDLAPYTPRLACWRLDDTEALILTTDPSSGRSAAALHAQLMEHPMPLALLRPGTGFSTWEGSPLWLRLAGIAKPASLGVLLAESAPARLHVMRQEDGFEVTRIRGGQAPHPRRLAPSTALLDQLAYGGAPPSTATTAIHAARVLPDPLRFRVQEAWAAFRRMEARLPPEAGATLLSRFGDLATRGRSILDRVLDGDVHGLDALDGLGLAIALDRLPSGHTGQALTL